MAIIEVDGQKLDAADDANLLEVCLSHQLDLPYFCWHPAMGSVGSCRQCAVRVYADENDQRGKILMSCMTPVQDGMRLSIKEAGVSDFRDKCIEVTMANHPHDCPVCEEGGECHLQDMTIMSDYTSRRYRGKKKTYKNQYLGPCIGHEMNRCITCYRCVRFYRDYAGGKDLAAMASRENTYFGRHEEGCLESKFSGNLVEVCPTGVFTDKTLSRSYNRKWDLQSAPSICEGCSLGCNISPSERYGKIRRVTNRYHYDINGYFICDRGRFGYDHVNHDTRIRECFKPQSEQEAITYDEGIASASQLLSDIEQGKVFGIGSDRASVEENLLLRQLVGDENFCSGLNTKQHQTQQRVMAVLRDPEIHTPTLREIEDCDAVLILGEDIMNTAARMALSVRQATDNAGKALAAQARIPLWQDEAVRTIAQQTRSPLIIVSVAPTELDEIACQTHRFAPRDVARLGQTIAHALDNSVASSHQQFQTQAQSIAKILSSAKNPLIISGTGSNSPEIVDAAATIVKALNKTNGRHNKLALVANNANSVGLAASVGESGCDLEQVFATVSGNPDQYSLLILQNDLQSLSPTQRKKLLSDCKYSVVLEQHPTDATVDADLVIPAKAVMETEGTFVNNEGRAQRFFEVFATDNPNLKDNWKSLVNIARAHCNKVSESRLRPLAEIKIFDEVVNFVSKLGGDFEQWQEIAPNSALRIAGMKVPRQPHRYSGRTSINADKNVAEQKQTQDEDSALAFSMEGAPINVPSSLNASVWSPGWNSNEAVNKFQDEVDGHLRGGDPGIRIIKPSTTSTIAENIGDLKDVTLEGKKLLAIAAARFFDGDRRLTLSSALLQRAESPAAQINGATAARLNLATGQSIRITNGDVSLQCQLRVIDAIPDNLLILPNTSPYQSKFVMASLPSPVEVEVEVQAL